MVKFQAINFLLAILSLTKIAVTVKYTHRARLKKGVFYNFYISKNGIRLPFTLFLDDFRNPSQI